MKLFKFDKMKKVIIGILVMFFFSCTNSGIVWFPPENIRETLYSGPATHTWNIDIYRTKKTGLDSLKYYPANFNTDDWPDKILIPWTDYNKLGDLPKIYKQYHIQESIDDFIKWQKLDTITTGSNKIYISVLCRYGRNAEGKKEKLEIQDMGIYLPDKSKLYVIRWFR